MKLVIVESPAKAKTIGKYLGGDFAVESSIGHIRDLPRNAEEIPEKIKGEKWSRLGVDVNNGFTPIYIVPQEKKQQVKLLKDLLTKADALYLATDGDREGEAIAWHLAEVLGPKVPVHRMVFHEITKDAVQEAITHPREIDAHLVQAQEARRILDRLYGFELSPVLWKKVRPKLSAGRVQSVATRIVVERERERMAFTKAGYASLTGTFSKEKKEVFSASLTAVNSVRVAQGKDFDSAGKPTQGVLVLTHEEADKLAHGLSDAQATVTEVARRPYRRSPMPPFRTSTLQQAASGRLGFSSSRTMAAAQRLYEAGHITYMRTDSTALSKEAVEHARQMAATRYGKDAVAEEPRTYANKVKNAQEAHEAIRPAGAFTPPEELKDLIGDAAKIYDLIWRRTIASQMADARGETVSVTLEAKVPATSAGSARADSSVVPQSGTTCAFQTSGTVITAPGFKHVYDAKDPAAEEDGSTDSPHGQEMPHLAEGDRVEATAMEARDHETKPPARYTEASLIKRLEELGIGRPSTYASIMSTIQNRGYVEKRGTALVPTFTAFSTVQLLEQHFPKLVDYGFTAAMEDHLDEISRGEQEAVTWLSRFYFGEKNDGLKSQVEERVEQIDARAVNSVSLGNDAKGRPVVARAGRYGAYVQRVDPSDPSGPGETAPIPAGTAPDEITADSADAFFEANNKENILGEDPQTGLPVHLKNGRFGHYVQVGDMPENNGKAVKKSDKPKTASLFTTMTPETLTLEDALRLLALPREVGEDPETKEMITAQNGPYGPYLKRGPSADSGQADNRSLETEDQIFTVTIEEAQELFRQPKRRRGAKPPLAELGVDPNSGKNIVIKEGRFGPYITDGETNVSLRRDEDPKEIEADEAITRLVEKRAAGPSVKASRASKVKTTKKATARKTAKKAAKRTPKKK